MGVEIGYSPPLLSPFPGGGLAEDCYKVAVYAPATSIVLTRESGLKPLTKFDFKVRARNAVHGGEWSTVSEYIGMYVGGQTIILFPSYLANHY